MFRKPDEDASWYLGLYKSSRALHGWVRKHGGSRQDAEDVVQEAVIICRRYTLTHAGREHNLPALFMTIGKKCWLMELRKRKPETSLDIVAEIPWTTGLEDVLSKEEKYR